MTKFTQLFALFIIFAFAEGNCNPLPDQSLVFVILAHANSDATKGLWKRSYESVRKFYPLTPIVIIDDHSPFPISCDQLTNAMVIQSEFRGAGELLPYYYFLKYQWAEKMLFLHDSMFLKRPLEEHELQPPIKFHWHFTTHFWDKDCPIDEMLSYLNDSEALIQYNHESKNLWYGCFGTASLIKLSVLQDIENKYAFTENLKLVATQRGHRMALERIFAILLFRENYLQLKTCSNFGDISNFSSAFHMNIKDQELEKIIATYPGAIIKTWHGR